MAKIYRHVLPHVHNEIRTWKNRAHLIPNKELRTQALASIEDKTFHCEGGGILALVSMHAKEPIISFIVAYQTISDYLDNLCDRSTSLDPKDFTALHQSMKDALTPGAPIQRYYRYREEQEDGGYLADLVKTCQSTLGKLTTYPIIKDYLLTLCSYYCDLQVHKHVAHEERVPRLQSWHNEHSPNLPEMDWHEFSACSGSTLGIFSLVAHAHQTGFTEETAKRIMKGYFPYVQGVHILLDYVIDQQEDIEGGDLNFCTYYPDQETMFKRIVHFMEEADVAINQLPEARFHQMIHRGIVGIYLSDQKVEQQAHVKKLAKAVLKKGGFESYFFYWNGVAYRNVFKRIIKPIIRPSKAIS